MAGWGAARPGKELSGAAGHGAERLGSPWIGQARLCMAMLANVRRGRARQGYAASFLNAAWYSSSLSLIAPGITIVCHLGSRIHS